MTSSAVVRVGVGTRLVHDGELVEIVEVRAGQTGMDVTLQNQSKQLVLRANLHELLMSEGTRVIADSEGPGSDDDVDVAGEFLRKTCEARQSKVLQSRRDSGRSLSDERGFLLGKEGVDGGFVVSRRTESSLRQPFLVQGLIQCLEVGPGEEPFGFRVGARGAGGQRRGEFNGLH